VNGSVGQVIRFSTAKEAAEAKTEIANAGDPSTPAPLKAPLTDDPSRRWPVVRFTSGMTMLITFHDFTVNNALGEVEARREQVGPLMRSSSPSCQLTFRVGAFDPGVGPERPQVPRADVGACQG
jgi:hypothetical protein